MRRWWLGDLGWFKVGSCDPHTTDSAWIRTCCKYLLTKRCPACPECCFHSGQSRRCRLPSCCAMLHLECMYDCSSRWKAEPWAELELSYLSRPSVLPSATPLLILHKKVICSFVFALMIVQSHVVTVGLCAQVTTPTPPEVYLLPKFPQFFFSQYVRTVNVVPRNKTSS